MSALAVYYLDAPLRWEGLTRTLATARQLKLGPTGPVENTDEAHSTLSPAIEDAARGTVRYNVRHVTELVVEEILIPLEDAQRNLADNVGGPCRSRTVTTGYRKVKRFQVDVDLISQEVRVFAVKSVANALIRRLKANNVLSCRDLQVDLRSISGIGGVDRLVGLWSKHTGFANVRGSFGGEDPEADVDPDAERKVVYGKKTLPGGSMADICITADCKFSSTTLDEEDLLEAFEDVKRQIGVSPVGGAATESISPSENNHFHRAVITRLDDFVGS